MDECHKGVCVCLIFSSHVCQAKQPAKKVAAASVDDDSEGSDFDPASDSEADADTEVS